MGSAVAQIILVPHQLAGRICNSGSVVLRYDAIPVNGNEAQVITGPLWADQNCLVTFCGVHVKLKSLEISTSFCPSSCKASFFGLFMQPIQY